MWFKIFKTEKQKPERPDLVPIRKDWIACNSTDDKIVKGEVGREDGVESGPGE